MYSFKIEGVEDVTKGLNNMARSISPKGSAMLDRAAAETKGHMKEEAPAASGALQRSIDITAPSQFTRIIKPFLLYGEAQETRNNQPQGMPPIDKIARWAQVMAATTTPWGGKAQQAAFLIARKIRDSGYPANPFVKRTYGWVQGMISKHISPFIEGIVAEYGKA